MILLMPDFTIAASGRTNRCPEKSGAAQGQQGIELDPAGGAERGEHVTMGQSTDDLNGVGGGKQLLAAQHGAQLLDLLGRPVGEVLEGSVLGLAILAITLAQQDGWR